MQNYYLKNINNSLISYFDFIAIDVVNNMVFFGEHNIKISDVWNMTRRNLSLFELMANQISTDLPGRWYVY